jgi:sugar phosphate isomerase/epimerase
MPLPDFAALSWGFSSWIYASLELLEALRRLAHHRVKFVEIWCNGFHLDPRYPHPDVHEVKRTLITLQMQVSSLHAPFSHFDIQMPLAERNRYWLEQMKKTIEYAQVLGSSIVVAHPVYTARRLSPLAQADQQVEVVECTEAMWKDLLAFLSGKGIRLALENMHGKSAPHFSHPAELRELIQRLGDEHLGICFDPGHALGSNIPIGEALKAGGSAIITLHINDNLRGTMDLHMVPGRGMICWSEFFGGLDALGYRGVFLCEVAGRKDPDKQIEETRTALQQLLQKYLEMQTTT